MICAAEDVGNADPQALVVAVNAAQAAERIGIPEANIILSQAVTYVATAPKSNAACMAVQKAMEAVRNERTMPVPVHLQDKHYKGERKSWDTGQATSMLTTIPSIMCSSSICPKVWREPYFTNLLTMAMRNR